MEYRKALQGFAVDVCLGLGMYADQLNKNIVNPISGRVPNGVAKKYSQLKELDRFDRGLITVFGGTCLAAVTSFPFLVQHAIGVAEAEQNSVRIQAEVKLPDFSHVVKIKHEQPLMPGDRDEAILEKSDGSTCEVGLRIPQGWLDFDKPLPIVTDWSDCAN